MPGLVFLMRSSGSWVSSAEVTPGRADSSTCPRDVRDRRSVMNDAAARKVVGIWIDHREAILVFLTGEDTDILRIFSNVERHPRRNAVHSTGRFESQLVPADDCRERRHTGLLARFYDEVVTCIAGTEAIVILGPGEAKGEFLAHLEKTGLAGRTVSVEAGARMTDGRLVRAVRKHFPDPASPHGKKVPARAAPGAHA